MRNREKPRLHRRKQKRAGEIIRNLRDKVVFLETEHSRLTEAGQLLSWKYNSLKDQLRQRDEMQYKKRVEPASPPRPFKYWYEVFLMSKDLIYSTPIDKPLFVVLDEGGDTCASATATGVNIPVEDILFGTLRELVECVLPRNLVAIIQDHILDIDNIKQGFLQHTPSGAIMYRGIPIDLRALNDLAYMRERHPNR